MVYLLKSLKKIKCCFFSGELGKIAVTFKISSIRHSYRATYCIYSLSCVSNKMILSEF